MRQLLAILGFFCITSTSLLAHHLPPGMEDVDEFDDHTAAFTAGIRHPLLGMDHMLFAMAVGVVATLGTTRAAKAAPVFLMTAIIAGAASGLQGVVLHTFHCALVTGLLAVLIWPVVRSSRSALMLLLIAMLALWQGNQHGIAWPLVTGGVWYLAGLLAMTAALVLSGIAISRLASVMMRLQIPATVTTH